MNLWKNTMRRMSSESWSRTNLMLKVLSLEIVFGADSLSVRGYGIPIDSAGWKRLSVMLGQGRMAGSDLIIKPKTNGIGSKNFGLKSLFSFGPRIFHSVSRTANGIGLSKRNFAQTAARTQFQTQTWSRDPSTVQDSRRRQSGAIWVGAGEDRL